MRSYILGRVRGVAAMIQKTTKDTRAESTSQVGQQNTNRARVTKSPVTLDSLRPVELDDDSIRRWNSMIITPTGLPPQHWICSRKISFFLVETWKVSASGGSTFCCTSHNEQIHSARPCSMCSLARVSRSFRRGFFGFFFFRGTGTHFLSFHSTIFHPPLWFPSEAVWDQPYSP